MRLLKEDFSGYRMTELGPLPEEWRVVRLGDIASFETGKREKGGAKRNGDVLSIGGEHITEDGRIDWSVSPKYISMAFFEQLRYGKVRQGDVLVVKDGARTGKSAYVYEVPKPGLAVNEHVFIVRASSTEVEREFLGFWFRSEIAWDQVNLSYHGLIGGINRRDIESFILSLPPLPEQRAIAYVLRTVQRAKEVTERVIAALRELKKSLMRHLFTYGPVPVGATDQVALQDTPIGPLPAHWRLIKLGEVAEKPQYGYTSSAIPEPVGPKFLRITDIRNDRVHWASVPYCVIEDDLLHKYRLRRGDILFARIGATTGKTYLISECPQAVFASYLIRIRTDASQLLPKYLYFFTYTPQYWQQINAAKGGRLKQGINIPILTTLRLPLPPLDEQRQIARILQTVDDKIEAEEARKEALDNLFRSLLRHLMAAKIRVPRGMVKVFESSEEFLGRKEEP